MAETTPPDPSLDDVRKELRRLGYLRDPIGGLILPHSKAPATFARAALASGARAGLLGGILLAGPLSAALGYLSRPHFGGWRDHFVLAAYLLPLLASAIFVLSLGADLLVRALARRSETARRHGEALAGVAGALLAAAGSAYLGVVWGIREPSGPSASGAVVAGVVLILGAGLLLGWIVRSGALVAVLSSGGRLTHVGGSGGAFVWIGVAAGTVGAIVLAAAGAAREKPAVASALPPISAEPVPGRVIVVGVDGLDASWLTTLLKRGSFPSLSKLEGSAATYTIRPLGSLVPPEVWTTMATGVTGDVHGVRSFEIHRLFGMRSPLIAAPGARHALGSAFRLLALAPPEIAEEAPLSSYLRRARAVWEIAQAAGLRTAVINWWGTWPARAEGGLTVSDRALSALMERAGGGARSEPPPPGDLAYPETYESRLERTFAARRRDVEARRNQAQKILPAAGAPAKRLFDAAFLIDGFHLDLAVEAFDLHRADVMFVYLPGQDLLTGGEAGGAGGAEGLASALWTVSAQLALLGELDRGLGLLMDRMAPGDLLVLLGDPGRRFRRDRGADARGFAHLYGPRVRKSGPAGEGRELDVAPTLLALCGLPQASDLPGKPLPGLAEVVGGGLGTGRVASFGVRPVPSWSDIERSDDYLERLRSLGYIQ